MESYLAEELHKESISHDEMKQKVSQIEKFIEERLKIDLDDACEKRDQIFNEIADYVQLKQNIQLVQRETKRPLELKVNMGLDFYVSGLVPNTDLIVVDIGLGILVEMTLDEAIQYTEKREKFLESRGKELTERITDIQGHIQILLNGLNHLK